MAVGVLYSLAGEQKDVYTQAEGEIVYMKLLIKREPLYGGIFPATYK